MNGALLTEGACLNSEGEPSQYGAHHFGPRIAIHENNEDLRMKCSSLPSLRSAFLAGAMLACFFPNFVNSANAQRLPSTVIPEHYALTLTPDLKNATFAGVESIDLYSRIRRIQSPSTPPKLPFKRSKLLTAANSRQPQSHSTRTTNKRPSTSLECFPLAKRRLQSATRAS